jgi:hypothetical protein
MASRLDSNPSARDERGRVTDSEIRQQPELWSMTVERVASSEAGKIVQGRAGVIWGMGSSAYAASAVAATPW